ncbi:MAG TPA: 5-(carboxyamino)imidazole ribonucleotide mutase [Bryobacterales bacterium]|nr:5-(carboxyamino)imidazole ribonucleotide mutase [Bryobacterales bacterium]
MSDTTNQKPLVGILMGSDSDLPIMADAAKTLQKFAIPFEIEITSAHRSPARTQEYARTARERGLKAIIVGAGGAAHLAGVIAAESTLPVIGVPIPSSALQGMDALLSTVQMPGGVPVATMAIGKAGAVNAAIYAAQIIATSDARVAAALAAYKQDLARGVAEKNEKAKREFQV